MRRHLRPTYAYSRTMRKAWIAQRPSMACHSAPRLTTGRDLFLFKNAAPNRLAHHETLGMQGKLSSAGFVVACAKAEPLSWFR